MYDEYLGDGEGEGCPHPPMHRSLCRGHVRDDCEWGPVSCPWCGDDCVLRRDLRVHLTHQCPHRTVRCRCCHAPVSQSFAQRHLEQCAEAPATCAYCGEGGLRRGALDAHYETKRCHFFSMRWSYRFIVYVVCACAGRGMVVRWYGGTVCVCVCVYMCMCVYVCVRMSVCAVGIRCV